MEQVLSPKIEQMLNEQIGREFFSAYLYMSMSAYLEAKGLKGYAHWFMTQAQEERDHALILYNYALRAGGRVRLMTIEQPKFEFGGVEEVLQDTLDHERFITASIYDIVDIANSERDHKTAQMLKWFVDEQVEEEDNATNNLDQYRMFGQDGKGLFMLDKELSARVYVQAAPLTGQ